MKKVILTIMALILISSAYAFTSSPSEIFNFEDENTTSNTTGTYWTQYNTPTFIDGGGIYGKGICSNCTGSNAYLSNSGLMQYNKSVCFFINLTQNFGGAGKGQFQNYDDGDHVFYDNSDAPTDLGWAEWETGGGDAIFSTTKYTMNLNQIYSVCLSYNASHFQYFVDGSLSDSQAGGAGRSLKYGTTSIGKGYARYVAAVWYDVCSWNNAITEADASEHNTYGCGGEPPSPPTISDITCISSVPDDTTEPYESPIATPIFTLTTNEDANCSSSDDNATWKLGTTTGGTSHTLNNITLSGKDIFYINCNDSDDGLSTYTSINVTIFTNDTYFMKVNDIYRMRMLSWGYFGYGVTDPQTYIHTLGLAIGEGSPNTSLWLAPGENALADSWGVRSKEKFKENIIEYKQESEDVLTYRYTMKGTEKGKPVYDLVKDRGYKLDCYEEIQTDLKKPIEAENGSYCYNISYEKSYRKMVGFENDMLGFMVEDLPDEVKTEDGNIDLYSLSAWIYKKQSDKIWELEREIKILKSELCEHKKYSWCE